MCHRPGNAGEYFFSEPFDLWPKVHLHLLGVKNKHTCRSVANLLCTIFLSHGQKKSPSFCDLFFSSDLSQQIGMYLLWLTPSNKFLKTKNKTILWWKINKPKRAIALNILVNRELRSSKFVLSPTPFRD